MKLPPPLQKGDTIALASPARFVLSAEVQHFIRFAAEQGWKVRLDREALAQYYQFGGTDYQRAAHMQALILDPEVKAIVATRGGYGCLRILDKIDFSAMLDHPKWLVGFSDLTVFHAQLQRLGMCSLHAPMALNLGPDEAESFQRMAMVLTGNLLPEHLPAHPLNINGSTRGMLVGGNLSLIYALKGSSTLPSLEGKILFLEDVDEYLYHIDRMMLSLQRAGLLSGLAGMIIGAFTQMKDNNQPFGATAEEIVFQHVAEYGYPVCFGFPAGHIHGQHPLVLGTTVELKVTTRDIVLSYL